MNKIDKCFDCDRWKNVHHESSIIPCNDLVCAMCQASADLCGQNDKFEERVVEISVKRG